MGLFLAQLEVQFFSHFFGSWWGHLGDFFYGMRPSKRLSPYSRQISGLPLGERWAL